MKLKYKIFSLFLLIGCPAIGQENDSIEIYLTKFQHVVFVSPDSIYCMTRFIEPSGYFYFRSGFADSSFSDNGFLVTINKREVTGRYSLKFKYYSDIIDTILFNYPIKCEELKGDSGMNFDNEIRCSYILKQFGETNLINSEQNVIRILEPSNNSHFSNYYRVLKLRFFSDSSMIYITCGRTIDSNGVQLTSKDSTLLTKKDTRNLKKEFNKINEIEDKECIEPGNPWMLEYKYNAQYRRFIVSYYCIHDKYLPYKKEFYPIIGFYGSIRGICRKYFKLNSNLYYQEIF